MTVPLTPEEKRDVDRLTEMAAIAATTDTMRCCIAGEPMLYLPGDRALVPGHIYSDGGLREARISRTCEYHFDRMFEPGWVDPVTGEEGDTPDYADEEPEGDEEP